MLRIISVILLSLMLIIPTVVLYQNNIEITENYEMLTIDFDNLTINFDNLEDDLFNLEKEKQQLDNELTSLQTIHNSLMSDYEESQNTLTQLEQTLEDINRQKTTLESEIQQRKNEILQLIEDGNAKQSEIISLTTDLTRRINDLDLLTTRSLELETQISIQDENIENQKQTIDNLEDERTELIEQRNEITEERNQLVVENIQLAEDNARLELLLNEGDLENRDEILRLGINSRQSVVRIGHTGGRLVGTGFFVSNNGCIITNLHVTNAATNSEDQMLIHFPDGREYTGDLLKEGSLNRGEERNIDIALVKISATTVPLPLSNSTPQYEDTAILIGHPGELGAWVIAAGSYNGVSPYSWSTNDYLFSLPSVFGGSSGSPILNMNGEVIALNWGSIVHTPLNQNNDLIVWKDNLGKFIMENQYSLAETSIDIISFLNDTECRI